jgi:hypothetical protein
VSRTTYYTNAYSSPLTGLQVITNSRWVSCVRAGKHQPGLELTYPRPYANVDIRLPICGNCGVPMPSKTVTWNGHL